jgi:hypothetical protein
MISEKLFSGVVNSAFEVASQSPSITKGARGIIEIDGLVATATRDDGAWQVVVAPELEAWERDLDAVHLLHLYFNAVLCLP